ncbi:hypothetical protein CBL_10732 [Carabus blaptoides fortunei]
MVDLALSYFVKNRSVLERTVEQAGRWIKSIARRRIGQRRYRSSNPITCRQLVIKGTHLSEKTDESILFSTTQKHQHQRHLWNGSTSTDGSIIQRQTRRRSWWCNLLLPGLPLAGRARWTGQDLGGVLPVKYAAIRDCTARLITGRVLQ